MPQTHHDIARVAIDIQDVKLIDEAVQTILEKRKWMMGFENIGRKATAKLAEELFHIAIGMEVDLERRVVKVDPRVGNVSETLGDRVHQEMSAGSLMANDQQLGPLGSGKRYGHRAAQEHHGFYMAGSTTGPLFFA
jgi:hypothetical protein